MTRAQSFQIFDGHGDVKYERIDRILNSLKLEYVMYVKGGQKQKLITEFILHNIVVK